MVGPMTQLRRVGWAHELSPRLKLKEETSADDETAPVAEDVGLFVGEHHKQARRAREARCA